MDMVSFASAVPSLGQDQDVGFSFWAARAKNDESTIPSSPLLVSAFMHMVMYFVLIELLKVLVFSFHCFSTFIFSFVVYGRTIIDRLRLADDRGYSNFYEDPIHSLSAP